MNHFSLFFIFLFSTMMDEISSYQMLLYETSVIGLSPTASDCLLSAENRFLDFQSRIKNGTAPPLYQASLDPETWADNYELGAYRVPINFSYSGILQDGTKYQSNYSANSMMRVDIRPRHWYTDALPFLARHAQAVGGGFCKQGQRIGDCYFNATTGMFNARTVGMIVISNCVTSTILAHGSANTTCAKDIPQISAWIVQPMPIHDAFCPCSEPKRTPGAFCIPSSDSNATKK